MPRNPRKKKLQWWVPVAIVIPSLVVLTVLLSVTGVLDKLPLGNLFNAMGLKDDAPAQAMLTRINYWRAQAGVPPVTLDTDFTNACRKHVEYLHRNRNNPKAQDMNVHTEYADLPGYSEEGLNAAGSSVIAFGMSPTQAVDAWMETLYHRTPMMKASLKSMGGHAMNGILAMDVRNGVEGSDTKEVVVPGQGQTGVPLTFQDEAPDPVPPGNGQAGFPVTIHFPEDWDVSGLKGTMTDGAGKPVKVHVSHEKSPARSDWPQEGTLCLIPARPLSPGATYKVAVTGTVQGAPYSKQWSFSTKASATASR